MAEPPSKKLKSGSQIFKATYTEEWPCIVKSKLSEHHAFCSICSSDFSIGHSGRFDCKTHVGSAKHKRLESLKSKNSNISSMFKTMRESKTADEESSAATKVMKAEVFMADFIAKHNLSLSVADELPQLIKKMCPDSSIAKDISCKRKKTTILINEMAVMCQEQIIDKMRKMPFTISTDGSNDMGGSKLFPVVVRTISEDGVHSEVVSVPVCEGSATGKNIFELIDNFFSKKDIPWSNCIAIGSDNANVMTGQKKGFFGFCKDKHSEIILSGCPLHLVHLAAEKGADALPISPQDLLVDIYFYFEKSSLRSHRLSQFQELYGKDQLKVIKHGSTRWLSMGRCLDRLLVNWLPLKEFFKEESTRKDLSSYAARKVAKILESLRSRSTRLYIMFLRYAIKPMETFLTINQSDSPRISTISFESAKLIRNIMTRFLVPSAFVGNKPVYEVDFKSSYNFKSDKDLIIGEDCLKFIANKDSNGLSPSKLKVFYEDVRKYLQTVVAYLLKSLPVQDPLMTKLSIADPSLLSTSSSNDITFFAHKFPILIPSDVSQDTLIEQFADLQCRPFPSTPDQRIDQYWVAAANFQEHGSKPFAAISSFMLGILTIPHSSAHCERVFSCVRKIKTDQRSSLSPHTLESLLILKHRQPTTLDCAALSLAQVKRLKSSYTAFVKGDKS